MRPAQTRRFQANLRAWTRVRRATAVLVFLLLAGCAGAPDAPSTSTPASPAVPASVATPATTAPAVGDAGLLQNPGVARIASGAITRFGEGNSPAIEFPVAPGEPAIAPVDGTVGVPWSIGGRSALNVTPASGSYRVVLLGVAADPGIAGTAVKTGAAIGKTQADRVGLATIDPSGSRATCPASHTTRDALAALGTDLCLYGETAWRPGDPGGGPEMDPRAATEARLAALPSCANATPFMVSPIVERDLAGIIPLGNVNPPEHTIPSDHVYFLYPRVNAGAGASVTRAVDVLAPGDIIVYEISGLHQSRDGVENDDFAVYYAACREVRAWFGHVSTLEGRLKDAFEGATDRDCQDYGDAATNSTFHLCTARLDHRASAGERLGTGGAKASAALDMGARDSRAPPPTGIANAARLPENEKTIVCPLGLFTDPPRSAMRAQLGNAGVPRAAEPRCGTPFQDVAGTMQGAWFSPALPPTSGVGPDAWHASAELAHEATDGVAGVLAIGGPGPTQRLLFTPRHEGVVDREFGEVAPGPTVYCYGGTSADVAVLARLVDAGHLDLEEKPGPCGGGPFEMGHPTPYVR